MIQSLPIQNIVRRPDVRPLNIDAVASIADSIASVGLINPVRVRATGDGWEVIAGSHRLEACKRLGLVEIECIVVADDDLHAELAMIDENLMRAELSASERASQTARRKAIYLELHPETAAHVAGAYGSNKAQGNATDNLSAASFSAETAKATGKDERTVRRDAERGEKVIPEVIAMIAGTKLDTGTYLDRIKNLSPNDQVVAAKRDLSALRSNEKPQKPTPAPKNEFDVHEAQVSALMAAWNKASKEARDDFLSRIDTPVFDRSVA
ncbi:ParB N-terminal domain-containing protein [Martelella sp. FLE1502]